MGSLIVTDTSPAEQSRVADGSDAPDIAGFFKRVAANLVGGARVALFRPFSGCDFHAGIWHLVVLALIDVCIAMAYDYLSIEPERYFSVYGLTYTATAYLIFVFAVFVVTSIQSDQEWTSKLLIIIMSTLPVVSVISLSITHAYVYSDHYNPVGGWLMWLTWLAWGLAIVFRVLKDRYPASRQRVAALVFLYALVNVIPRFLIHDESFWYSYNPEDYAASDGRNSVDTETVYYAQQRLLTQTASNLVAHRPGVADLYFVGFGSYAPQDVFMKEVNFVRGLFDANFGTEGRSVALINNVETVHDLPLANSSNLRIMLKEIASRMDTEEDVLFLFLTSHGSKDAVLSVDFWPIDPNDLSAGELQDVLAESGIKWRIVVVSACYSGSFIESLKNDHTLIMTAAHESKTSFGCSNDRELTYFGEHFFAGELQTGSSFVQAFDRAKLTLRERELKEDIGPSDPQIFIGSEMAIKLKELEDGFRLTAPGLTRSANADSGDCQQDAALSRAAGAESSDCHEDAALARPAATM